VRSIPQSAENRMSSDPDPERSEIPTEDVEEARVGGADGELHVTDRVVLRGDPT
jgi:hypothetical protein